MDFRSTEVGYAMQKGVDTHSVQTNYPSVRRSWDGRGDFCLYLFRVRRKVPV